MTNAQAISRTADPPAVFFDELYRSFRLACEACGGERLFAYRVAGWPILLRFAGPALLQRVIPAIEHLACPASPEAALQVCLFDSTTTGTPAPAPGWPPDAYGARGAISGFNTERFHTVYDPGVDILHMLDRERNLAVYWSPSPARIPWWESTFPMRTILHWWMRDRPLQPLHAGAVGLPDGGVLIAGPSGSGKSTTTLACLHSPLLYAGDDYVVGSIDDPPWVYSLYGTAKLEADNLQRFPELGPLVSNPDRLDKQKAVIYLGRHFPEKLISGFPLKAILAPRVTGLRDTRLVPAGPMASLKAIAPTTLFHLPGAGREAFAKLTALVRRTPTYFLEAGSDLVQIPETILGLLSRGGA